MTDVNLEGNVSEQMRNKKINVVIIDPKQEYNQLEKVVHVKNVSKNSNVINPFSISGTEEAGIYFGKSLKSSEQYIIGIHKNNTPNAIALGKSGKDKPCKFKQEK